VVRSPHVPVVRTRPLDRNVDVVNARIAKNQDKARQPTAGAAASDCLASQEEPVNSRR